ISRFCGVSGSARPTLTSVRGTAISRPGRACSIVPLSTAPLLHDLPRREAGERAGWHVVGDHRACGDPYVVSELHWCNEDIVDAGPDVTADPCPPLRLTRLMREVGRHVAGSDVGVLAHVSIPDVGQMRDLRACPDARVLDLDERARLGVPLEHGARAKVTEGADDRTRADLGVDGHDVRPELGAG